MSLVILLLSAGAFLFSRCVHSGTVVSADPRGGTYAGAAACLSCHKSISGSYWHSAHAQTSAVADLQTVKGAFTKPADEFSYGATGRVSLQQRDSGLYQVAITKAGERAERFDIAVGSGRKAQTYLYWKGNTVYQLPVSYFVTEHNWANSPHYPTDSIWFGRAVMTDCFECHATFIKSKKGVALDAFHQVDQYVREPVIYGIDCERCHGPGAAHVNWQAEHPEERSAKYIKGYASLSRQQRLDMCAACHSGVHAKEKSIFHFQPGDLLSNYYYPDARIADPASMDVHGNQYQLLKGSKCYLQSSTLDCVSCHDPHVQERDNLSGFARRCMSCHTTGHGTGQAGAAQAGTGEQAPFCRMAEKLDTTFLVTNCINCHMPARASVAITMQTAAQKDPVADLVRNHYIAIYPGETKKVLAAGGGH